MKAQLINPWSSKWTIQLYRGHTIICYTNKIASVLTLNERKTAIDLHPSYASIFVQFEHLNHNIVCMCVFFPFVLDVRLVGRTSRGTQAEGHTGFLIHLPCAVLALIFLARRIQPFLSLVDREVEFCVRTNLSFSTCWTFLFLFFIF